MSDNPLLKPSDFAFTSSPFRSANMEITLEEMERKLITDSLKRYDKNISVVSGKLGITRQTLYNKMKVYGL
ncbi:MAG: helix-turn-helix domain-containing protein [Bacteroidales bacterium]|nr:helix-turn-helix domain-containing protein [Bacteroidales bacterium]